MSRAGLAAALAFGAMMALGACGMSASPKPPLKSTTSTGSPGATSTTSSRGAGLPTTAATGPVAGPVAPDFQVQSATFISAEDGWVLGTSDCRPGACAPGTLTASIAHTTDGGSRWVAMPAPHDTLDSTPYPPAPSGVGEVRFADARDGWVYAPDLWTTHDGGATWARVDIGSPGSQVVDLEASGGEVDAVVTRCNSSSEVPCPAELWHSPVGSDGFTQVSGVSLPGGIIRSAALALHGATGYLVANDRSRSGVELWITTDGRTWTLHPSPCPDGAGLTSVAPIDASRVAVLCTGQGAAGSSAKQVLLSSDSGRSFVPASAQRFGAGDGGQLSAASPSTLALATSSAASFIELSTNGGASFTTSLVLTDGGLGWGDFGFTDASQGFAVHAPANHADYGNNGNPYQYDRHPATLFMTFDGGAKWTPITI